MRILHFNALYPPIVHGGAERFVANLAEEQTRRGYDVGVVTLTRTPEPVRKENGVSVYGIGHANLYWPEDWPKHAAPVRYVNKLLESWNPVTLARVRNVLDSFQPDVVNSHSMVGFAASAWMAAGERNIPIAHTLHDFNLFCRNGNAFREGAVCEGICLACRVAQPKRWFSQYVSAVVGISRDTLERHIERGLFAHLPPGSRSVIWSIPSLVEPRAVSPRPADAPFVIGFIGRISPEKGLDVLIDAVAKLPPRGWRLRIAGTISAALDAAALRARTAGMPVDWLGFVSAPDFYRDIDLLVVPSIWAEPFGLVVLEAYSFGVPVVGSRIGGIADIVDHGTTGWLFEPGDSRALHLILDERIRMGRGERPRSEAFATIIAATTASHVAAQYDQVYAGIIDNKKIRPQ